MAKFKENWLVYVIMMLITLTGNIIFYSFKEADQSIKHSASVEYVNSKDDEMKAEYRLSDKELKEEIDLKVDKERFEAFMLRFETMDTRIFEMHRDMSNNRNN